MSLTRDKVLATLKEIRRPDGTDLVAAGLVRALDVTDGAVRFVMDIHPDQLAEITPLRDQAEAALRAIGADPVSIVATSHQAPPNLKQPKPAASGAKRIPGVDRVLAIASGKGGVGKSTVSANLATALASKGRRVGLLDADVYGPSQHRMLGVSGRPASPDGTVILPLRNHGVTLMSLGLMTQDGEAVVWRGPMLMGALQQMLFQVQWGKLDVLIVDLPPGTGDVQMTLSQKTVVDAAVIVSTPQDIALIDARKGIDMFEKLNVPIKGLIENMSTHICSNCGFEEPLFGHGGVAAEARKMDVPLLAEIPLHLNIRTASDGGAPVVVSDPQSPQAQVFQSLADRLMDLGAA